MSKPPQMPEARPAPEERQAKLPCDDDTGIDQDIDVVLGLLRERYAHRLEKTNAKFDRKALVRRVVQGRIPHR